MKLWVASIICDLTEKHGSEPMSIAENGGTGFLWVSDTGKILSRFWPCDKRLVTYHKNYQREFIYHSNGVVAEELVISGSSMESQYFDEAGNPISLEDHYGSL